MKAIINGKVYDTATGEYLAGQNPSMFDNGYWGPSEHLYRNSNGDFFLYGNRRFSNSEYFHRPGVFDCDEKIVPLSADDADAWAWEFMETSAYNTIFGTG